MPTPQSQKQPPAAVPDDRAIAAVVLMAMSDRKIGLVADRLGRPRQWLYRRLRGDISFTVAELYEIADYLNTDISALLPHSGDPR